MLFATKRWLFVVKMFYIYGKKNLHASLKVWKKHSLLIDFSKFSKIMCHDGFLIMQIVRSEPNYVIAHLCIIPEALNKVIWRVDTLFLFCFVAGGWREDSLKKKKCDLQKKAKFNTSYLITSWILRCNWIRCIKPTLLFPSVKHKFSTMWDISVFIITCTCIIMSL